MKRVASDIGCLSFVLCRTVPRASHKPGRRPRARALGGGRLTPVRPCPSPAGQGQPAAAAFAHCPTGPGVAVARPAVAMPAVPGEGEDLLHTDVAGACFARFQLPRWPTFRRAVATWVRVSLMWPRSGGVSFFDREARSGGRPWSRRNPRAASTFFLLASRAVVLWTTAVVVA